MNSLRFEEISLGREEKFSHIFSTADVDLFAKLSGDTSPIHMDSSTAHARGLSNRVVHGLLSASLFSRMVGVYLPGSTALLHKLELSFSSPIYPDMPLHVSVVVTGKQDAYKQIEMKAKIEDKDGKVLVRAKIWAGVHE